MEVDVPEMNFLMIDGSGDPNAPGPFSEAVEALFSLSYTLKFMVKKGAAGIDYSVMPLEGLWWADDMDNFMTHGQVRLEMDPDDYAARTGFRFHGGLRRVSKLAAGKNPAALRGLRFESFHEGLSAQTLHIGPFSEEGPVIAGIHEYIEKSGRKLRGFHHEIYLSDTRRARPEKWKTVLRQPMS